MSQSPSFPQSRRRWFQFRLRTLLGVMLLAALFLGWWFQPFVVETRRDDGSLRTRFELCRDWRGRMVSHGTQVWYFRDGTSCKKADYGTPLEDNEFGSLLVADMELSSPYIGWLITEKTESGEWPSIKDPSPVIWEAGSEQSAEPTDK